ncbi:MarR family transcriptional regulator [Corynebacterium alimapuense]|uniref:MarR family transcriptional regulator n=2 Tax=Corynebacterium alimapuense TaxID=1576874 RepID=A0A3M8K738_9CORY|nr:MarR family transcriptional regulator [Corynebacterium alimapuense]
MHLLWDHGDLMIREIIDYLPGNPAYTTIATVLRHLAGKGMVVVIKDGRFARHAAKMSREHYTAELMDQALSASRNREASILHFVDNMEDQDRELLRQYLHDQEQQQ